MKSILGIIFLATSSLAAQDLPELQSDTLVDSPDERAALDRLNIGYDPFLQLGGSFQFVDNTNVIGRQEGTAYHLGLFFSSAADYLMAPHEWRNSLFVREQFSRGPVIDRFVKTTDTLSFQSIYLYHIPGMEWWGPFARFALDTSIFKNEDVREDNIDYEITYSDATTETLSDRSSLKLSTMFEPLTLRESLGIFVQPVNRSEIAWEMRFGGGARQTFADGALVVRDDETTTGVIEVGELDRLSQIGLEAATMFKGQLPEWRLLYSASAEAMLPLWDNLEDQTDKTKWERTNYELKGELAYNLMKYASLSYQVAAVREPQILDRWQVVNSLLLNIAITPITGKTREASAGLSQGGVNF